MKLKYVAASKLLLSNWSIPKLDRILEQTDVPPYEIVTE